MSFIIFQHRTLNMFAPCDEFKVKCCNEIYFYVCFSNYYYYFSIASKENFAIPKIHFLSTTANVNRYANVAAVVSVLNQVKSREMSKMEHWNIFAVQQFVALTHGFALRSSMSITKSQFYASLIPYRFPMSVICKSKFKFCSSFRAEMIFLNS